MSIARTSVLLGVCAGIAAALMPQTAGSQVVPHAIQVQRVRAVSTEVLDVGHIAAIAADPDGRLYVLDSWPGSEQLVVINPDGRRIRLARAGEGPGELVEPIHSLPWKGDTLLVLDRELMRITGFVGGDAPPHTSRWPSGVSFPFKAYGSGTSILGVNVSSGDHIRVTYTRFGPGAAASTLPALTDSIAGNSYVYCSTANRDEMSGYDAPFRNPLSLTALLPNGTLARARPGERRITLVNSQTGSLLRSFEVAVPATRLRPDDWYRTTDGAWVRQAERDGGGRLLDFPARTRPCELYNLLPEFAPPIFSIQTDDASRIWAEVVDPAISSGLTLVAHRSDGTLIGKAPMPERDARVDFVIRGSLLYLATADQLGVQSVEVYRMIIPDF